MLELAQFPAALHVPQPRRFVNTAGDHLAAIRRESECGEAVAVALKLPDFPAALHVPQPCNPMPGARQEGTPIRREGDDIDACRVLKKPLPIIGARRAL